MTRRSAAFTALLLGLALAQAGCTAVVGAAIRHAKTTAPSVERFSFSRPVRQVREHAVKTLATIGASASDDDPSRELVGLDSDKLYKYTLAIQPASNSADAVLSIQVEMIGDWEKVGWTTTREKSKAFVDRLAASLGVAPVSIEGAN